MLTHVHTRMHTKRTHTHTRMHTHTHTHAHTHTYAHTHTRMHTHTRSTVLQRELNNIHIMLTVVKGYNFVSFLIAPVGHWPFSGQVHHFG